jgi:hypothetical protein
MKAGLRIYLGIALALLLVLTSQTMAIARGAAPPVDQLVLCTGAGSVTVLLDAEGKPTGQVHICPDCIFSALAGVIPPVSLDVWTPQTSQIYTPATKTTFRVSAVTPFCARAPPETV